MISSSDLSLVFADSEGHPVVFKIPEGTTTLGSADDNDVVLPDESVSAHQVVIIRDGDLDARLTATAVGLPRWEESGVGPGTAWRGRPRPGSPSSLRRTS